MPKSIPAQTFRGRHSCLRLGGGKIFNAVTYNITPVRRITTGGI